MHQHDNTDQIVQSIFKLITAKTHTPFNKVKKLFIKGDPLITQQFWNALNAKHPNQYKEVYHCPGCDKFYLEKKLTSWKSFITSLGF